MQDLLNGDQRLVNASVHIDQMLRNGSCDVCLTTPHITEALPGCPAIPKTELPRFNSRDFQKLLNSYVSDHAIDYH